VGSKNHNNYALQEFICVESEICKLHFNGRKTDRQTDTMASLYPLMDMHMHFSEFL